MGLLSSSPWGGYVLKEGHQGTSPRCPGQLRVWDSLSPRDGASGW